MQFKSFCKNQREVAQTMNTVIDLYWCGKIEEKEMIYHIEKIYMNNKEKVVRGDAYTKVLQQQCGKKRLEIISKLINRIG